MDTVEQMLSARADDERIGFIHESGSWTYRQIIEEGRRRAAMFESIADPQRPPHIGLLSHNTPEYLFWLVAAGLSGAVIVGINSTYRGAELAQLIDHTDCQVLVTAPDLAELLDSAAHGLDSSRVVITDSPEYHARLTETTAWQPARLPDADDLFLLIFTSGSTGMPKAVRCTQGRFARGSVHVANIAGLADMDVVYAPLPFFHSSSLFTGWSSALRAAVPLATRTRFSASKSTSDIRAYGATFLAYTGKILNYMLAVAESPSDADVPLRIAIGNEASEQDIKTFSRRFGCMVRDSYGSTEGVIIVRRDPAMPAGALGLAAESVTVIDPDSGLECPRAEYDDQGRVTNLADAVGEMVDTQPTAAFEGYYKNDAATNERFRGGWYWSGDLAFRDADGWFYFAGRSNEWLRVDGENFSAAPVEKIVGRHPDVRSVAVYAVPDPDVGDRVMAALELRAGAAFDPDEFDAFLATQPDLGTKWTPSFVRIDAELPKLASMKLDKTRLRREAWTVGDVWWRPRKGDRLRPLTSSDHPDRPQTAV